jgi:sporulation protein YlmC with PRC-barrel domain
MGGLGEVIVQEVVDMLEEASEIENLEVFTPWGVSVGLITSLEVDAESGEISSLFLEETNEKMVENGESILIPFRWIQAVGDIVLLRYFPEDIPVKSMEDVGLEEFQYE